MKSTKHLLVIAGGSYVYGAEKVTLDVIEGLSKKDYNIFAIINGWNDGRFAGFLRGLKIDYDQIFLGWYYSSRLLWSLQSLFYYPGAVLKYLKLKKNFKRKPTYFISFRPIVLLWPFLDGKVIYHVHDVSSKDVQTRFFLRIADRRISRYIAVSDFVKRDLISCGIPRDKIEVIHNGVEFLTNVSCPQNNVHDDLVLGIIGQVIPRKGHEDLITAMKILSDKGIKSIRLKIVGDGDPSFRRQLETLVTESNLESRVLFTGFLSSTDEIYRDINVVVTPTRNDEPFALVPLEANAMARPVIVTDTGGFPEMVIDGYNGFIVQGSSPEQIACRIELFVFDRGLLTTMGSNGRENVYKNFRRESMIEKLKGVLDKLQ